MRKQDTAALNTHALVARVEELGIKQYWLARKLDVTTRTVNRWMTGKVKRLSRENLDRMVEVLKLSHAELTTADEGDVFATRAEQTKAANLLVLRETEDLFIATQQFAAYEQLLKATLHPDLTLAQLAVMYNQLLIANAMQHKFDDARMMAERCIDCASRCGDVAHEMAARTGLAIIDAEQGLLSEARKKLELMVDLQESIGSSIRHRCNTYLNLGTVYRFLGEMKKSAEMSNLTIEYHSQHGRAEYCASVYKSSGLLARDIGQLAAAGPFFDVSRELLVSEKSRRDLGELEVYALEVRSLQGERGLVGELRSVMERLRSFTYFGDTHFASAAGIMRREGDPVEAASYVAQGLAAGSTRRYERGLLQQEAARIAVFQGQDKEALRRLHEAGKIFRACGMLKRCSEDPSLEVGQQFKAVGAKLKLNWRPNYLVEEAVAA